MCCVPQKPARVGLERSMLEAYPQATTKHAQQMCPRSRIYERRERREEKVCVREEKVVTSRYYLDAPSGKSV